MKRILSVLSSLIVISAFISCEKAGVGLYEPQAEAKIIASIHLEATTANNSIEIGLPESQLTAGENITLFVPFEINQDDIEDARLQIKDHETGALLGEYLLHSFTEASASGINVPIPLDGTSYLFAGVELTNDFIGKRVDVTALIVASKSFAEPALPGAFAIQ